MNADVHEPDICLPNWGTEGSVDLFDDTWSGPVSHRLGSHADWREQRADLAWRGFDSTPHWRAWQRRAYERVVRSFWPTLTATLGPADARGRYDARVALARVPIALRDYAAQADAAHLEAYLDAQQRRFADAIGPVERGCHCRACARQRSLVKEAARRPRDEQIRAAFLSEAEYHLKLILAAPNSYDRRLGAPPLAWDRRAATRLEVPHAV